MIPDSTFVIPDAHGNAPLVRGLLEQEGIIEFDWESDVNELQVRRIMSRSEVEVVQLGDLANCVSNSIYADCESLDLVSSGLINVMLVGNHEHPYFGGPSFNGFWPAGEVRMKLNGIERRGDLKAAHAVDDIVITHAGVPTWVVRKLGDNPTATSIADQLNEAWRDNPAGPFFSAIGQARGGWGVNGGGILWSDWKETKPRGLRQIFGHTVGKNIKTRGSITCLDLGAGKRGTRIAGAWIRDGEVEIVIHEDNEVKYPT